MVSEIEVWWPDSKTRQIFKDVAVDRAYRVVENDDRLASVPLKMFEFGKSKIAHPVHHGAQ